MRGQVIGTILLFGGSRSGTVGAARILVRRGLRSGGVLGAGQFFGTLESRLDFVDNAKIADEFCAASINEMRLPVGSAIDACGCKISNARLLPIESCERSEDEEHGAERNAAVSYALRIERAEPGKNGFPAGEGFARAERFVENVVNEALGRLDFRERAHSGQRVSDAGDKRSATSASVYVRVKLVLFGG